MPKATSRPQTPVAFVRAIVEAYERRGIDPGAALRQASLQPELLDPDGRVAIEPFETLSACAMRELDDEALGWFSRRLPWGSYGMLCRASLTAPTLDVALQRWCRHHGLLTEDVRIDLRVEGRTAAVRIEEQHDLGALREFCLVSLLRNLHGIACWLADSRIALVGASFPFPAPAHARAYGRMFGGGIAFDAPAAEVRFDAVYLELPVVRDDAALRRMLQKPISLMARQYRQDRLLSQRIKGFIAGDSGMPPHAGAIAEHLNISVRSLQRHLQEEGTTVLTLTSTARRLRAEDLLRRGDVPIKRVASLVGYGGESSFGRAFRSWTGQSPAAFRRNAASPSTIPTSPAPGAGNRRLTVARCRVSRDNAAGLGPVHRHRRLGLRPAPHRLPGWRGRPEKASRGRTCFQFGWQPGSCRRHNARSWIPFACRWEMVLSRYSAIEPAVPDAVASEVTTCSSVKPGT